MYLEEFPSHILIYLKVIPKSSRQEIVGILGDRIKMKITTAPEAGKANKEIINFLSKALGISRSTIEIIQGETSPTKTIKIEGITKDYFSARIKL